MKQHRIQVYVNKETKDKIVKLAREREVSESLIVSEAIKRSFDDKK